MNRRSSKRLVGEDRRQVAAGLRKRYEAGESTTKLQAATGYSFNLVRRLLVEAGTRIRGRQPYARHLRGQERQQLAADLRKRYEAGASVPELAKDVGGSMSRVRTLLRESGYAPRPIDRRNGKRARQAAEARQLYEAGQSIFDIARMWRADPVRVRDLVLEAGGTIGHRPPRRPPRPSYLEGQMQMLRAARHQVVVAGSAGSRSVALAEARRQLDATIARAHDHGCTYVEIGAAVGISGARAWQLAQRHRREMARRHSLEMAPRLARATSTNLEGKSVAEPS